METRTKKNQKIHKRVKKVEKNLFWKKIRKIFLFLFFVFITIVLYAKFIGTSFIKIHEYSIKDKQLPNSFHGFKVVHFTDLNYGSTIFEEELEELAQKINDLTPDLIVFTGNLTKYKYKLSSEDINILTSFLNNITAATGKYIIKGNNDYNKEFNQIIIKTDFILLDNSYDLIFYKDQNPILLTGTASLLKEEADIATSLVYLKENDLFTISLIHEPDILDEIINNKVNVVLAGHSLLGQIRLPFIGGLYDFKGSEKYKNSFYDINNTKMYVSSGLGTSFLNLRLLNHPSINFYRLVN
ncbi:MAG: hypothetical protein GX861_01740 [Tenericutes bacterium]|nr:hypothetical protein [Mycoplasmatota bacterium]